jgi:hypothetical protein
MTTKLRRYLNRQGEGAVSRLAEATGYAHSHISRVADGHKRASLRCAIAISRATGLRPHDLNLPDDVTTSKGKRKMARERA